MGEHFNFDGSVELFDDGDPARTHLVQGGGDLAAARLAFFGPEAAPRYTIRKSTVVRRLIEASKIDIAMGAIMSNAAAFAKWTAPDWPEIYNDDADAVALLTAIGADLAVILAPEG